MPNNTLRTSPLLIVLFPENTIGAADKILGQGVVKARREIGDLAHGWYGSVWVIQGKDWKNIDNPDTGMFGVYLDAASKPKRHVPYTPFSNRMRTINTTMEEVLNHLKENIRKFRLAKKVPIVLSGAWYSEKKQAEINWMKAALEGLGYTVELRAVLKNPYNEVDDELVYESL
jgi:hypothetical protein